MKHFVKIKSDPHLAHYIVDPADLVPHVMSKLIVPGKRRHYEESHDALTGGPGPGRHHRSGEARH